MATGVGDFPGATESVYIVPGETSPDAITKSLQALLLTRRYPIVRQRFTVLDTFDGRVRRAGARLTRTGVNGTTTLTWRPQVGPSSLEVRLTQPVHFAWDLPEGQLQKVLAPVIGVRRLLAQADAEEHGSLLDVLGGRGKTVARLRIESGQARLPASPRRAWQPLPTVVTLTGLRGYQEAYERLVPIIESRPGIRPCPEGLQDVILRQVGAPELGDPSCPRVEIAPTVRADAGARQIHLALLRALVANEPGLRANLDTEFLHDFRVALRRTRSLLGQIKGVFPPDVVEYFSTEFSWMGRLTGPPRDLDVLVLALRAAPVPAADQEALMAFLGRAHQQQRDGLIEALDSDRYLRLRSDWQAFLEGAVPIGSEAPNASRPLRDVVSRRAWRLSRRIAGRADAIDEHTEPDRIHEVRIDAKKLRYLVDVAPAFYDAADLECILSALKKLQRVLGDFNDASVHETRLLEIARALGDAGGPAGAQLTLRRLADESRQRRERLRAEVMTKLVQFRAEATQSACRRAFKHGESSERAR